MKTNTIHINYANPVVIISIEEYEYLKSLEDAIKHPERYRKNDDPDYLTPEEIVLFYETDKKIKEGNISDFMSLDEYLEKRSMINSN